MAEYWLGLGANLGDRAATLRSALAGLDALPGGRVTAVSPVFETAPVGVLDQPSFLNLAAVLESRLPPEELLQRTLALENEHGRVRSTRWGPRTLDIDVLWWSGGAWASEALVLPHPRMGERAFVLQPLARIRPGGAVGGASVATLASQVGCEGVVEWGPLDWEARPT